MNSENHNRLSRAKLSNYEKFKLLNEKWPLSGRMEAKKTMIIGVDARPVSYPQLTGIGVYLNNLLQALQELDQENHYYLISNGAIHFEVVNPRWKKIEGRLPQSKISTLWMQFCIPHIASAVKLDLFWGLRHQLPLSLI